MSRFSARLQRLVRGSAGIHINNSDSPRRGWGDNGIVLELARYRAEVDSVFNLLGRQENDLTAALGFVFARCPKLLAAVLHRVLPADHALTVGAAAVGLEVRDEQGRTDLEVRLADRLIIFEAKAGWLLPTAAQLAKYAPRVAGFPSGGVLVSLSQASHDLAKTTLTPSVAGVPVVHLPWRDVLADIAAVRTTCRGHERLWLDELHTYLKGVMRVRPVADSMTYCVVVNHARPGGGGARTFRQYVTQENCYFHPYGVGGWPTDPPRFIAFRWDGAVQRVHRIIHTEVVSSLLDRWPDVPADRVTSTAHAIYDLGPRLPPLKPLPNGRKYRASRLWVMLDQLQSSATLAEAIEGTRQLRGNA
ncbi:hypothetical protein [Mycobacterium sp.]|uniref:hypothetical protein n=1 Tax=Mycobacterium sp. TaxID=1785 RepID=UPI0025D075BD|nr:hypothetical protein [Mycobacterium sp.]